MTTRREFLVACSTAAAGMAVVPEAALATSAAPACSFAQMGLGHFAAQLRTTFRVNPKSAATVPLKLVKAEAYACLSGAASAPDAANEKFSLLFRGPADQPLSQDTYSFDHKALGQFTMFIVPVGAESADGKRFYQAVFNRPAGRPVQTV
jgi:hypothetical protein